MTSKKAKASALPEVQMPSRSALDSYHWIGSLLVLGLGIYSMVQAL